MKFTWKKPVVEDLEVNGECTAYAGAVRPDSLAARPDGAGRIASRASSAPRARATPGATTRRTIAGSPID